MERLVIIIAGPTCSGKTYLSLELAKLLSTEIISADSRQIYRELEIGTAKPTAQELASVKHHLINVYSPTEDFNASIFEEKALEIIEKLFKNNKIPIVAGGTGLYIDALINGISKEAETSSEYRSELMKLREKLGNEHLYEILKEKDPKSAEKMLPQNWKRVIRALEVLYVTGKPIWEIHQLSKRQTNIKYLMYGLNWDREILYENINRRVDKMINNGLLDEVKFLIEKYSKELNSLNTVGYKELIPTLEGEYSLERGIELIKRNSRRYAKRQMTWFRRYPDIRWLEIKEKSDLNNYAEKINSYVKNNYIG